MKYYINYNTGAGNETVEGTLEDAMQKAVEGLEYTQEDVNIYAADSGKPVATLRWYGCTPTQDDVITCRFGDIGFYGEWEVA